ncbi:MAG: MFS transporter [Anaerolineae bacterium]|nr:MFS transporter [Anaerolineae bacterium]
MHKPKPTARVTRHAARFVLILLLIEFLDEFVFGVREAAWPLIRADLGLTYAQIGLLLGIPNVISNVIEPFLAILGDVWKRRVLVLGGGAVFALALLLAALSRDFGLLLLSFVLLYPASGAFVSLSQATLMDLQPSRREHNMARWTLAGSIGVVGGPLILGAAVSLGFDWRGLFAALAMLTVVTVLIAWRIPFDDHAPRGQGQGALNAALFGQGLRQALHALRRGEVWRWLLLLEASDLVLDVFLGFLALYMVDVTGASEGQAAVAVAVWTGVGLLGDLLLIPLLERVQGTRYLRVSALLVLVLFPAFLLAPGIDGKLLLLGALGFLNAGWYAILQAGLYSAMPGQSGTALAVKNVSGLFAGLIPLALGLIAQRFGLQVAMWLMLLGPIALLVGLPRGESSRLQSP